MTGNPLAKDVPRLARYLDLIFIEAFKSALRQYPQVRHRKRL
jgi:hypothetical protein